MASRTADSAECDGSEVKSGSKLDNLSREDLIKFVKKQMVLLQKSKTHSDELTQQLNEAKRQLKVASDSKNVETKSEESDERENLIQAYNASQSALEESAAKIMSLTEQMNCLQQKNDTLTALFQCMQSELDATTSRNKELESALSKAHDKESVNNQSAVEQFVCPNCGEMQNKMDQLSVSLVELKQRIESLEPVEAERDQLKQDLSQSQEKLSRAAVFIDKLKKERSQLKEQNTEIQTSQSAFVDLQEAFDRVKLELATCTEENLQLVEKLKKAEDDVTSCQKEHEIVIRDREALTLEFKNLQTAFDDLNAGLKNSEKDKATCSEKLKDLDNSLNCSEEKNACLQIQLNDTMTNLQELTKAYDNVKQQLDNALHHMSTADEELSKFNTQLDEIGEVVRQQNPDACLGLDAVQLVKDACNQLISAREELLLEKRNGSELQDRVMQLEVEQSKLIDDNKEIARELVKRDVSNDNETLNLLRQVDELKADVESHVKQEQELTDTNEELKLQIKELESRCRVGFTEQISVNSESSIQNDDNVTAERQFSKESVESLQDAEQNISEKDVLLQEVMFLREKLADWETMMSMLQKEKDGFEKELTKMAERETANNDLLEEILQALQNALKGRDLFHDQTKTIEDNGMLYAKLSVLQSIVDETNFERDEMREKIQHLNEQVTDLERRLSQNLASEESTVNSKVENSASSDTLVCDTKTSVEGSGDLLSDLAEKDMGPKALRESDEVLGQLYKKIEAQTAEILDLQRLLNGEKLVAEKWQCRSEENQKLVEQLQMEKEILEKNLLEREKEDGLHETITPEQVQTGVGNETSAGEDGQEMSGDVSCGVSEAELTSANESGELLMTEHVQMTTVRKNGRMVMHLLSQEESRLVSEENVRLKEEITRLKELIATAETSEHQAQGQGSEQRTQTIHRLHDYESTDDSVTDERKLEALRISEDKGKDEEISRLKEQNQKFKDESDAQIIELKNRLQEIMAEFSTNKEDTTLLITGKDIEIQRLSSLLSEIRAEGESLAGDRNDETMKLRQELVNVQEDLEFRLKAKDEMIQNIERQLALSRDELTVLADKNIESNEELKCMISSVREEAADRELELENMKKKIENINTEKEELIRAKDDAILALKEEFDKSTEEKNLLLDEKQKLLTEVLHLREVEIQFKDENDQVLIMAGDLEKLRSEFEKKFAEKEANLAELKEKSLEYKECESLLRDRENEVEALKTELGKVKEEAEVCFRERESVVDDLKLKLENVKKETDMSCSDKNQELEKLREEHMTLKKEFESQLRDRDVEIEVQKTELSKLKEEMEVSIKEKETEADRAKMELRNIREETEIASTSKTQELEDLHAEIMMLRKDFESQIEVKHTEIQKLEKELQMIQAETENHLRYKDQEIERITREHDVDKKETESLLACRGEELQTLKEEIFVVESQLKNKTAELESFRTQLVIVENQNRNISEAENKIVELQNDLAKVQGEFADLSSRRNAELESMRVELENEKQAKECTTSSKESEIQKLEKKVEELTVVCNEVDELNVKLTELKKEYDEVKTALNEKEHEIIRLKEEAEAHQSRSEQSFDRKAEDSFEVQSPRMELAQAQSSPSSDKTVAALEQQLKEREERENKLKQLTLKAKKEAAELKTKLSASQKDLEIARTKLKEANNYNESTQSVQYQSLQTEYDQLESRFETEKSLRQDLEKSLKLAVEELGNVKVTVADLSEDKSKSVWDLQKLDKEKKDLEVAFTEKEQELHAERIQREQIARDKAEVDTKLQKLEYQLKETEEEMKSEAKQLQERLTFTTRELDLAKTGIQQSNMMDLEIADYERAVKALNETVAERNTKIKALQEEIERQQEQKTAVQKLLDSSSGQYSQLDDHCNKLKQLLVKSKKDLAEAKKLETEQRTADAQLRGQLERLTQLTEEQKLQITQLVTENQKQAEKLRQHSDTHQRSVQTLEMRVQSLKQELQVATSELTTVQAEYDGYKVRVHSVLKNQKTKSSANEDVSLEQERFERQQQEKLIESLKAKVSDVSQQMSSLSLEFEQLQDEHERLQTRQAKLITEMENNERSWRDRCEKQSAENALNSGRQAELIHQLTSQSEEVSSRYKDQIQSLQEEHQRVVDSLKQQLESAEIELDRYHARFQMPAGNPMMLSLQMPEHDASSDRVLEYVKEIRPEERQAGEGSENIEDVHTKMMSAANHGLLPFEQLLDSTRMDDVISEKTMESTAEELALKASLASSEKRIEHLTQILNESEATVLRLTEQASILKTEIRRMERNQERETAISNMEYLKNVVYKFLTLKSGDERLQLIPVLTTMLKLSPDEKDKMTAIAMGADGMPPGQDASGWGAYLHRWSGLV